MNGKWTGWALFGSLLMMIIGVFKAISGLIGLFNDQWLLLGYSGYMLVDITWLAVWWLVVGLLLVFGGLAAMKGKAWGLVTGIFVAGLAAVSEFFMIPVYPIWSIMMIVVYVITLLAFVHSFPKES